MPIKNNFIGPKDLSIHYFMNGFSFCTHTKIDFVLSSPNDLSNFKNTLDEYFDYYPKASFASFSVLFFQSPSTFVPQQFFEESQTEQYLKLFKKTKETDHVVFDTLEGESNQVNLYTIPKGIKEALAQTDFHFKTSHYNTLLYKKIIALGSSNHFDHQVYIHIQNAAMDVFLRNKNQILFHNRFPVKNEDEFLYYLFFVVEQFDLKTEEFELIFLGKIPEFENFYKAANLYHNNCTYITEKEHYPKISLHHAPFLASYFY